jgi:hypothetical protein
LIVSEPLPRLTGPASFAAAGAAGAARPASGSATAAPSLTGAGERTTIPDFWMPPTTPMLPAVTWMKPLATTADGELESTTTGPLSLMVALPDSESAPLAFGSSAKIMPPTPKLLVPALVEAPPASVTRTLKVFPFNTTE